MNVYEKIQAVRVELQESNIKKSGKNTFANYTYHELGDFMPKITKLCKQYKIFPYIIFSESEAVLTILNVEKPEECVVFTSPMAEASLKGCHPIQNIGAVQTYQRRYLYMAAFEIVEHDALDAMTGKEAPQKPRSDKPQPQQQQPAQQQGGGIKATDQQKKKIFVMVRGMGIEKEQAKSIMKDRYNIESTDNLTKKQASDFIEHLGKLETGEAIK